MELELGLQITLIGISIVFIALFALIGVVKIPQLLLGQFGEKKEGLATRPAPTFPEKGIPPQHLAAIAAAIAALDHSYRINAIEILGNENWERSRFTEITSL